MFEERILVNRKNRLPKRGGVGSIRKEIRHYSFNGHASFDFTFLKSFFVRLYSSALRMLRGKNHNDYITIADGFGGTLELKDDELRSIEKEIPNMSLQLSLYLDAGLVVSMAFDELITANRDNDLALYKVLRALDKECREKNLPLINELFIFAQKIKSKSLMRFTSLVLDNKNKGNALADKLDKERSQLQNSRLNNAKAKAKEAETKLCFPLMLLLISLIIICSAPALMQM